MVQGSDSAAELIGVLDARRQPASPSPDEVLAGLSLALRAVLSLQQLGVARMVVVVTPPDGGLTNRLLADARVNAALVELEVEPSVLLWPRLQPRVDRRFVLCRHDWVLDPAIVRALVAGGKDAVATVASRGGRAVGAMVGPEGVLSRLENDDLDALLTCEDVAVYDVGEHWAHRVADAQGRRRATNALLDACRKPVDGWVSRHFNRHISLFISRLLVDSWVTPNTMTGVTFGVSLVAAAFALDGRYATTLVAAALMQLNSILDGCDGELARVRFQGSKLGQWLDTVGDDASNVIFWAALGVGAGAVPVYGRWLALAGYVAAAANALAALQNYALLSKLGSGDFYALRKSRRARASGGDRCGRAVLQRGVETGLLPDVDVRGCSVRLATPGARSRRHRRAHHHGQRHGS